MDTLNLRAPSSASCSSLIASWSSWPAQTCTIMQARDELAMASRLAIRFVWWTISCWRYDSKRKCKCTWGKNMCTWFRVTCFQMLSLQSQQQLSSGSWTFSTDFCSLSCLRSLWQRSRGEDNYFEKAGKVKTQLVSGSTLFKVPWFIDWLYLQNSESKGCSKWVWMVRVCLKGSEVVEVCRSSHILSTTSAHSPQIRVQKLIPWKNFQKPNRLHSESAVSCLRLISLKFPAHLRLRTIQASQRWWRRLGRPGGQWKTVASVPNKDLTYSPYIIHILGTSVLWYRQIKIHILIIIWVWIPCSQTFEDFGNGFNSLTCHALFCAARI